MSGRELITFLTRQTVFYTPTTLTVSKGDEVSGTLTCAPNARNNRDLDIEIKYKVNDVEEGMRYKMFVSSSSPHSDPSSFIIIWGIYANQLSGLNCTPFTDTMVSLLSS